MKQLLTLLFFSIACGTDLLGQDLALHYWIDGSVASRVTREVTGEVDMDVDVSGLDEGFHTLHLVVTGAGGLPSCTKSSFYVPAPAQQEEGRLCLEYWLDGRRADSRTQVAQDGIVNLDLDVDGLDEGFHTVSFAVTTASGLPSYSKSCFYVPGPAREEDGSLRLEYWLDGKFPAHRTSVAGGEAVQLDLDVSALGEGLHTVSFAVTTAAGVPTYTKSFFYIPAPQQQQEGELTLRYWVDGKFSSHKTHVAQGGIINLDMDVEDLTPGFHSVSLAVTTASGLPSYSKSSFYIPAPAPHNLKVSSYRYWINSDLDNAVTGEVEPQDNLLLVADVAVPQLPLSRIPDDAALTLLSPVEAQVLLASRRDTLHTTFANCEGNWGREEVTPFDNQRVLHLDVQELPLGGTLSLGDVSGLEMRLMKVMAHSSLKALFKASRPCTMTVIDGSLDTLFTIKGEESVEGRSLEMAAASSYYVAVHSALDDSGLDVTCDADKVEIAPQEWEAILALHRDLVERGWKDAWDVEAGAQAVGTFHGLQVEQGHVTVLDLSSQGLEGTLPASLAAFARLRRLGLSHNRLEGNIGELVQGLDRLQELDAHDNAIDEVRPMIPATVRSLDLSGQSMRRVVGLDLSVMTAGEILEAVPTVLLYDHSRREYRDAVSIVLDDGEGWAMRVDVRDGRVHLTSASQSNAYDGLSGDEIGASEGDCSFGVALTFDTGDANFLGGVDASDLQATILYALDEYDEEPFNLTAADTYPDSRINVQDVVCTVDLLLAIEPGAAARRSRGVVAGEGEREACLFVRGRDVVLRSATAVAAMDVKVRGEVQWNLGAWGMTQAVAPGGVVAYSLSGAVLPAGETVIGSCLPGTVIQHVSMADGGARLIPATAGDGDATAVTGTLGDGGASLFDTLGRKQARTVRGVNIVVTGDGRAVKMHSREEGMRRR